MQLREKQKQIKKKKAVETIGKTERTTYVLNPTSPFPRSHRASLSDKWCNPGPTHQQTKDIQHIWIFLQ